MYLTTKQAAAVVGCSTNKIGTLCREGKLPGAKQPGGRGIAGEWRIAMTRMDLKAAILQLSPRIAGRAEHRNGHGQAKLPLPTTMTVSDTLQAVVQWMEVPPSKRQRLLAIAQRFNEADLDLIVTL